MASFAAFLEVKGNRFPLLSYTLRIHQETDSLGRPASPTLGGTIDCVLSAPGSDQPFLLQWMFSPTMQEDGKIILMQDSPKATLKTISFFNAYCTGLQTQFTPGASGGGSLQMHLRISPQRVAVRAIIHDNNWPVVSHGAGETFTKQPLAFPPPSSAGLAERLTDGLSGLGAVIPPLNRGMDEGKTDLPPDHSRGPDYKPDLPTFDPSRTPDYPSADKPTQPTVADSLNRIEKVVGLIGDVAKAIFLPESSELTFPDSEGGSLTGRPTNINENQGDLKNVDSLQRENESAEVLQNNGYHVEQLPQSGKTGEKQPDYWINGHTFDCLAPHSSSPRNVASRIHEKVLKNQAKRVVLNLDYKNAPTIEAMREQLHNYPIDGLKEVLVVKDGEVVRIFP